MTVMLIGEGDAPEGEDEVPSRASSSVPSPSPDAALRDVPCAGRSRSCTGPSAQNAQSRKARFWVLPRGCPGRGAGRQARVGRLRKCSGSGSEIGATIGSARRAALTTNNHNLSPPLEYCGGTYCAECAPREMKAVMPWRMGATLQSTGVRDARLRPASMMQRELWR